MSERGSAHEHLTVRGAREHNLQDVDLRIPRDRLTVFTGLSGSGKSSLAFDTIYAEGQRRYVESLSAYARQFLGQMDKPDVDFIEGLSPAISIDQKSTSRNPRSTVGTITEIYDYLRLLYARVGHPHCPQCRTPIARQTAEQIVDRVAELPAGTRFQVLAPVVRGRKGEYSALFQQLATDGYARVRVDGTVHPIEEVPKLAKTRKHDIDVVVDRLVADPLDEVERLAPAREDDGIGAPREPQFLEALRERDERDALERQIGDALERSGQLRRTAVDDDELRRIGEPAPSRGSRVERFGLLGQQPLEAAAHDLAHGGRIVVRIDAELEAPVGLRARQSILENDHRADDLGAAEVGDVEALYAQRGLVELEPLPQVLEGRAP